MKPKTLAQPALFAALMCILCPLAIPLGPIPVTLATFIVLLAAYILPWKQAVCAVLLYLLMGLIGLPVFSGAQAGFSVLLGPTGGYLWSYVPMAMLAGVGKGEGRTGFISGAASLLLCYICGSMQYALLTGIDFVAAALACVVPFLPFDVVKLFAACLLGKKIRSRLQAAGLLD